MRRPKLEIFCPVVPFDRDVSSMTDAELRLYAASLPTPEYPPVRWAGDGLDESCWPDGTPFGPPKQDDLDALLAPPDGQWRSISNRTVMDLGALIAAFEQRAARAPADRPATGVPATAGACAGPHAVQPADACPPLVLMRCLIKRCNVDGLTAGPSLRILTCVFAEEARFTFAHFERGVDFLGSIFAAPAHFTGTVIREKAHFQSAAFLRGVWFHETRFEGEARFNEAAFNGPLVLEHARFTEAVDLSAAVCRGMSHIDLCGMRVAGRTTLAGDLKVRLEQIQGRVLGEHGEDLAAPGTPAPDRRARQAALQYAADQYSTLAANFAASAGPGYWRAADLCHSRYLDLWRKALWLRGRHWDWLKSGFFKVCLGNGIWVKYPLELALVVILAFGLIYSLALTHEIRADANVLAILGQAPPVVDVGKTPDAGTAPCVSCLSDIEPAYARVLTALYFSAITFTTVGYGDWHPVGWARLLAAAEALSGITIMSAFTVILVRKIIR